MKIRAFIYSGLCSCCLWAAGCSNEVSDADAEAQVTFYLTTRAAEDSGTPVAITDKQFTRLLLAERMPEHTTVDGKEELHCALSSRYDITGGRYQLEGLFGQWYKFAFVCVPAVNEMQGGRLFQARNVADTPVEHDFNKLMVDYAPVLDYQADSLKKAQGEDLAVYRKIIDLWIDPVNPSTEDVTLTRVTGELILDMGIPADQFEKPVRSITLNIPKAVVRLYIHDNTVDDVLTESEDGTATRSFEWTLDPDDPVEQNSRLVFKIALLPGELSPQGGFVIVSFNDNSVQSFKLQNDNNAPILIKKNIRTKVLFNGMYSNEFEIRYAGFDDNAEIDVPGDDWNGWH
ncbi:MAG: hypothetical protein J6J40_02035 [Parabacteroides sp.]|nr:hypothetical protein [Parabacteroides sp.]